MSLFGDFKKALSESPGRILWTQLQDTQQKMARLSEPIRTDALLKFLNKREKLALAIDNMTRDGQIELGKTLQKTARETFNLNISEGYALWLTGAWLESMNRPGLEAAQTFEFLDHVATSSGGTNI